MSSMPFEASLEAEFYDPSALRVAEFRAMHLPEGYTYRVVLTNDAGRQDLYYGYPDSPLNHYPDSPLPSSQTRWVSPEGMFPTSKTQELLAQRESAFHRERWASLRLPMDHPDRVNFAVRLTKYIWGDP